MPYALRAAVFILFASASSFAGLPLATAERMADVAFSAARKSVPPWPCSHACVMDAHDGEALEDDGEATDPLEQDARNIAAENTTPIIGKERIQVSECKISALRPICDALEPDQDYGRICQVARTRSHGKTRGEGGQG